MGHQHIVSGKWLIPVLLAFIGFAVLGSPQSVASDKDAEIRDTILRQIEAFANNDEEQAWAPASEGSKREAYPAVHNATAIEFTQRVPHGAFEIQVVRLQGPEGKRWDAYYRMVLTEGVWKVAGVRLQPAELGI